MRNFDTGATRSSADYKLDYEGFLSPVVLEAFAEYMHVNRLTEDGSLRESDNWQKGLPKEEYMKSMLRHLMEVWKMHRGFKAYDRKDGHELTIKESLGGLFFNVQGYLFELLKDEHVSK